MSDDDIDIDHAIVRRGLRGAAQGATYAGVTSFLRRSYRKDLSGVELAVMGVPFDTAVTNRPGTRFGPRAIREASSLQAWDPPFGWDIDPMEACDIADIGDLAFDHGKLWEFPALLRAKIAEILAANASSLVLGGDHYITYPILQAYAEKFGPMSLIQFDAHTDTWADDDPDRIDHGTMMYRAIKEGIVVPERSVQIGIRTVNADRMGVNIIDAPEYHRIGPEAAAMQAQEIVGDHPVYLSFDIDALDPGFAPGTGTPVSGGLSPAQAMASLRALKGIDLKGMDVVEVAPAYDPTEATAIAGAHMAVELMCLWACGPLRR